MRIGFDAKRAFFNYAGLGNYSRNTIRILENSYPSENYFLYTPKSKPGFFPDNTSNLSIKTPEKLLHKLFPAYWRSSRLTNELINDKIELFHGLSNELPHGIDQINIKSVVTIHDLIFLRFPQLYAPVDRKIYDVKFRYSCNAANKIIAVSQQTKEDIINYYQIPPEKIEVVYQGCDPVFHNEVPENIKNEIKKKYNLPDNYILNVGTIEERKNILTIVKALKEYSINVPLVIVGRPTKYLKQVQLYINEHKIKNVYFIHNAVTEDLPAIYQMASMFVYPSVFEGFGIPIIEALHSKIPVLTSKEGCFPEAGGAASVYVNPFDIEGIAVNIKKTLSDKSFANSLISEGEKHVEQFKDEVIAKQLMEIYKSVLG